MNQIGNILTQANNIEQQVGQYQKIYSEYIKKSFKYYPTEQQKELFNQTSLFKQQKERIKQNLNQAKENRLKQFDSILSNSSNNISFSMFKDKEFVWVLNQSKRSFGNDSELDQQNFKQSTTVRQERKNEGANRFIQNFKQNKLQNHQFNNIDIRALNHQVTVDRISKNAVKPKEYDQYLSQKTGIQILKRYNKIGKLQRRKWRNSGRSKFSFNLMSEIRKYQKQRKDPQNILKTHKTLQKSLQAL